jgi:hypothetical protein
MAGEFQNLGVAIKVIYPSKALEPMINEEAPFRAKLSKSVPAGSKASEGDLKFNGVLALPQNVGQIVDAGDLQDAAERAEVQFNLKPTIFQATMNIGWLTRKAANTAKSAFNGGEVRRRTEETVSNLGKYIESTYCSTVDGIRGFVESSSGSGLVMKDPEAVKLLRQGMKISVREALSLTTPIVSLDAVRIASVNAQTNTITTTGAPTYTNAALDDVVYVVVGIAANYALTNVFAESLRGLIDDGTYKTTIHGVDRTAVGNERLNATINDNGGSLRNLTEQMLIRTCHEVRDNVGKRLTDMWTGPGQIEKYIEFVAPERRRAVQGGTYDKSTGFKDGELVHYAPGTALKLNMSFDIIPREIFLLSWDTFFHYVSQEMQWVDDDSMLHLAIGANNSSYAARWDAFMASMENIGNDMPSANAVIRDLKDPVLGDT